MLLESFRSTFGVIAANVKPVCNLWLEVRSFETFSFLDRRRLSTEKVNMFATILNYTENEGPSFQTQTVATSLVSQRSKRIRCSRSPLLGASIPVVPLGQSCPVSFYF